MQRHDISRQVQQPPSEKSMVSNLAKVAARLAQPDSLMSLNARLADQDAAVLTERGLAGIIPYG